MPISASEHSFSTPASPLSSSPSTVPSASSLRTRINTHRRNSIADDGVQTVEQLLNPLSIGGSSSSSSYPSNASNSLNSLQHSSNSRLRHCSSNSADVIGVADGVGGWRQYGIDPGQFSYDVVDDAKNQD